MPGGQFLELLLLKWSDFDNSKIAAGHFTHNYGLDPFLDTLEVILMSNNMKESAEKLGVHYQTLLFRKQRIEKILAVSFDDFATKMSLLTALHLLKIRKK